MSRYTVILTYHTYKLLTIPPFGRDPALFYEI